MFAAYLPDKNNKKKRVKAPNLMDYEWESSIDPETKDTITALEAYNRDTKAMFHYFFEAIAQPSNKYWSRNKDNWDVVMSEQPWIAKDGFLYRGTREEFRENTEDTAPMSLEHLKQATGFNEHILAKSVMNYEDGAEYVVGQTVHLNYHRQEPRKSSSFDEKRTVIEWTILSIFVGTNKNKIDRQTGPVFVVFSEKGCRFTKQTNEVDGKLVDMNHLPDVYAYDWPRPRWKFVPYSKIKKVVDKQVRSFYPNILKLALNGYAHDPKMPDSELRNSTLAKRPAQSVSSSVIGSEEDNSGPAKKKPKKKKDKQVTPNPAKDQKLEAELLRKSETIIALEKKAKEQEKIAKAAQKELENFREDHHKFLQSNSANIAAVEQLKALRNDLLIFYATKYEAMDPKERKTMTLETTLPLAIRRHFSDEDLQPYTGKK